jgi:hypothetical protein
MRIRILIFINGMGICDLWSIDPLELHFQHLGLYLGAFQGPPRISFEPLKLLSFDFNADPDPAFHSNANPDPDRLPKIMRIHPDRNPDVSSSFCRPEMMRILIRNIASKRNYLCTVI